MTSWVHVSSMLLVCVVFCFSLCFSQTSNYYHTPAGWLAPLPAKHKSHRTVANCGLVGVCLSWWDLSWTSDDLHSTRSHTVSADISRHLSISQSPQSVSRQKDNLATTRSIQHDKTFTLHRGHTFFDNSVRWSCFLLLHYVEAKQSNHERRFCSFSWECCFLWSNRVLTEFCSCPELMIFHRGFCGKEGTAVSVAVALAVSWRLSLCVKGHFWCYILMSSLLQTANNLLMSSPYLQKPKHSMIVSKI